MKGVELVNFSGAFLVAPDRKKNGCYQASDNDHQKYGLNSLPHVRVGLTCCLCFLNAKAKGRAKLKI
jgi:hypothetical protein